MFSDIQPPSIRKLGDGLLVIGGGALFLVLTIYFMHFTGTVSSIRSLILSIVVGASILLCGVLIFIKAEGLQAVSQKIIPCYKGIAILVLNALVFCGGLELAAMTGSKIEALMSNPPSHLVVEGSPREKVSYYSSQDWAERYWYEFRLSRKQHYYPYVGWRRAPFKGETINVDQNGIRVTPGADCREGSFKVFAFGESSMWGTGSPDWATIPANLQKGLEKTSRGPVCVVNFAESAYVLMQDIITLIVQLQAGNKPDLVVFYNVEGDAYAAYQAGKAGVTQNLDQMAARFENANPPTFLDRLKATSSYALIDTIVGKLTIANPGQKPTPSRLLTYETMGIDLQTLSHSLAQNYFGEYQIVDALSRKYGFKFLFFLPPHLLLGDNKPLTVEEQQMKRDAESDPAFKNLLTATYQNIESESSKFPNIYPLDHVFDHYDSLIWIDAGHVTPTGNEIVAEKILAIIQTRFHGSR